MTNKETLDPKRHVHGDRPSHFHTPKGKEPIECNSPYCGDAGQLAEDPDDNAPIRQGREPWRGR